MTKTATINARIEPELKTQAESVLHSLGLKHSDAITLFYKQVIMNRGLPFSVNIPNDETISAINEDVSNHKRYSDVKELIADLNK